VFSFFISEEHIDEQMCADNIAVNPSSTFSSASASASASSSSSTSTSTACCQTDLKMCDLSHLLDEEVKDVKLLRRRLTVEDITKNDKTSKFYTGT